MSVVRAVVLACVVALLAAGDLCAQERRVAADEKGHGYATLGVFSDYVFRGQRRSDEWVLQPSVEIAYRGFDVNIFANWDSGPNDVNERILNVSYLFGRENFDLVLGYIYYDREFIEGLQTTVPRAYRDTQELFVSLGLRNVLFQPKLTYYQDIDRGGGGFLVASIGHSMPIQNMPVFRPPTLTLGASASMNLENKVMGGDDRFTNFYNGDVSAAFNVPLAENLTVELRLAYSFPLSGDAKRAIREVNVENESPYVVYGGAALTFSF